VLLGTTAEGDALVAAVRPIDNVRQDERRRRFLIDPRDYLAAEREAGTRGLELLGFYHSHPDHPARPSDFDRIHAWPHLHYVIVAVDRGEPGEVTSWLLREDRTAMDQEPVARDETVRTANATPQRAAFAAPGRQAQARDGGRMGTPLRGDE
jgi:proteasome lid subunit RPN8/RPN11